MTAGWGVFRSFWLRFALVFGGLVLWPFPLGSIPWTEQLAGWLSWPIAKYVDWMCFDVLGMPQLPPSDSADRAQDYAAWIAMLVLALAVALVWSALDRRRTRYPRLTAAVMLGLRYWLAVTVILYGAIKVAKSQMPDLSPNDLDTPLGELTPMGLAWAFIGYSTPYSVFAGMSELLAGALLLWRRTATLGALVAIVVMTNVVAMNLCYDIAVKLGAIPLLLTAIVLVLPVARRLLAATLGYAVPELPTPPRLAPRWQRAGWLLKLAILAGIQLGVAQTLHPERNDHVHELYGAWRVDDVTVDGVTRPPLATDIERWDRVLFNGHGMWTVSIRGERQPADLVVDATSHTLQRTPYDNFHREKAEHEVTETWRYDRPSADQLILDGVRGAERWHLTLHRAPPSRLISRGFHWVNDNVYRARDRSLP